MPLDTTDLMESVVADNLKNVAGGPAQAAVTLHQVVASANGILVQGGTSAYNRLQAICEGGTAAAMNNMINLDPAEAVAVARELTSAAGGDLGSLLAQITGAVAALQQAVKAAETTPPPTA